MYYYNVYGLKVAFQIEIPKLRQLKIQDTNVDTCIFFGPLKDSSLDFDPSSWRFKKSDGSFVIQILNVAYFVIHDKSKVMVYPDPKATIADIEAYLLAMVMGSVLNLNGFYVLHASLVEFSGRAVAFTGDSGIGKSCLAFGMQRKGYRILSDDLTSIRIQDSGASAFTAYPSFKLWRASLEAFGESVIEYEQVLNRMDKFVIPISHFQPGSLPLTKVIHLQHSNEEKPEVIKLERIEKLSLLKQNSYGAGVKEHFGPKDEHFRLSCQLLNQVEMELIRRPKGMLMDHFHEFIHKQLVEELACV